MILRQHRLRPVAASGVPSQPAGKPDLWTRDDAGSMGVAGARLLSNSDAGPPYQGFTAGVVDLDDPELTIEAFVRIDGASGSSFQLIAGAGASSTGTPGFRLFFHDTGAIQLEVGNGTARQTETLATAPAGSWVHVVVVVDRAGDVATCYIDGVTSGPVSYTAGAMGGDWSGNELTIGCDPSGTQFGVNGPMALVRFAQGYLYSAADAVTTFAYGNGLTFSQLSPALQAVQVRAYNANEATGVLRDATGNGDATEVNGPIAATAGPRESTVVDISGNGHRGTLVGLDPITSWSTDTPDGSYSAVKVDSVGGHDGIMTDFANVDAAHVADTPEGDVSPQVPDTGTGGNEGWKHGPLDSLSTDVPGGQFAGGSRSAFDSKGNYDSALEGFTSSPRDGSGGIVFDGTGYIDSGVKTVSGQGAKTYAAKFSSTYSTAYQAIMSEGRNDPSGAGGIGPALYLKESGAIRFVSGDASGTYMWDANTAVEDFNDGGEHSVVASFNGTTDADGVEVWVDGVLQVTKTSTAASQGGESGNPFRIGCHTNPPTNKFNGTLSDVAVTAGRAWTPAEVAAYHSDGTVPADATAAYPFDEPDTCQLSVAESFDGSAGDVSVDLGLSGAFAGTAPYSVEGWLWHGAGANDYVMSKRGTAPNGWGLYASAAGQLVMYHGDDNQTAITDLAFVPEGRWVHVAAVWDGSAMTLYMDGVECPLAANSCEPIDVPSDQPAFIGCRADGSGGPATFFGGKLAGVSFYDSALAPSAIKSLSFGNPAVGALSSYVFNERMRLPYLDGSTAIITTTDDWIAFNPLTIGDNEAYTVVHWVKGDPAGNPQHGYLYDAIRPIEYYGTTKQYGVYGSASWEMFPTEKEDWTLVAFTRDVDGNCRLYVDGNYIEITGVYVAGADFTVFLTDSSQGGTRRFAGTNIYADIIRRELTQDEIRDYQRSNVTPPVADGLRYEFKEGKRTIPHCAGGLSLQGADGGSVGLDDGLAVDLGGRSAISFGCWVKLDELTAGAQSIIQLTVESTSGKIHVSIGVDGVVSAFTRAAAGGVAQTPRTTTAIGTGYWVHVAGFVDLANDQAGLYFDGQEQPLVAPVSWAETEFTDEAGTSHLLLGSFQSTALHGLADYLCVYDGKLSDTDFGLLAQGLDPVGNTPLAIWPFDDGPQSGIPQDGDLIATITSKEGNRYVFTGPVAAQRPQWFAAVEALNSKPSCYYDGIDDCLDHMAKILSAADGVFQFAIHLLSGDEGGGAVYGQGDTGAGRVGLSATDQPEVVMGADSFEFSNSCITGKTHVVSIICSGGAYAIRVVTINEAGGTGTWWDAIAAIKSTLGAQAGASNSLFQAGYQPERIGYDSVITPEEINANEQYLINRYAAFRE